MYLGDDIVAQLEALSDVRLNRTNSALAKDELIEAARDCLVVVADATVRGTAELFDACPDLMAFVRPHVDIRNVDVDAASARGILVTRASAGFGTAVAELVLGFMIDLARGITTSTIASRAGGKVNVRPGRQLSGSSLGIIGYGHIGRHLSRLASMLGMRILVYDPKVKISDDASVEQVAFDVLLREADFIVPLAVATAETENMIDAAALAEAKRTAFLINVSRGELVDELALAEALDEKMIAGAALDVGMGERQRPSPRLAERPDVLSTPHIGGLTPAAVHHQAQEMVDQIKMILKGQLPPGAVNAAEAERLSRVVC